MLAEVTWKDFATRIASAQVTQFTQVADLLNALGERRDELLAEVTWKDFALRVASAEVAQFSQVADLLNALGKRRDDLLSEVAWKDLAPRVASAEVAQFTQVADLLNALGKRRGDLLSEVTWKDFALRVASAEVAQFTKVAVLLNALGERRHVLLDEVAWEDITHRVSAARVAQLGQLSSFLEVLEERRNQFVELVDWSPIACSIGETADLADLPMISQLLSTLGTQRGLLVEELSKTGHLEKLAARIHKPPLASFEDIAIFLRALGRPLPSMDSSSLVDAACKCRGEHLRGLTMLMASLDDEGRDDLLRALDWAKLCMKCPIKLGMLLTFGCCLENVYKKGKLSADFAGCDEVREYLSDNVEQIVCAIEASYTQAKDSPSFYSGIAKLSTIVIKLTRY